MKKSRMTNKQNHINCTINQGVDFLEVIDTTKKLISVLHQENSYLASFQVSQIGLLQDQKHQLIDVLQQYQKQIKNNKAATVNFTQENIAEARLLQEELQQESKINSKQLTRSMKVNHKILDCLKEACLRQSKKIVGYNNSGTYGDKFKASSELVSFSVGNYI